MKFKLKIIALVFTALAVASHALNDCHLTSGLWNIVVIIFWLREILPLARD